MDFPSCQNRADARMGLKTGATATDSALCKSSRICKSICDPDGKCRYVFCASAKIKKWKKKIADVTIKVTTGLNPRKNFVLGHGENYYVTIKNMGKNTFFLDEKCDKVDDEAIAKINKRSDLKKGDILFSGIGTIGRVALIDIPTSNWNVSESVFTLRANENISKEYLYLMLLDSNMQNYCQSHSHGAAQKGIRMADLKAFSFPLASKSIIDLFTSKAEPLLNRVSKIRRQLRLLTESRDRLLPKLLSGEIEV